MNVRLGTRRARCRRIRGAMDRWLDSRASHPIPPDVAEHVRECPNCRSYITTWNAVELRLRSAKESWPTPDAVQHAMVRMQHPAELPEDWLRRRPAPFGPRLWVVGLASTAAVILAIAIYLGVVLRSNTTLATGRPAPPTISVEAMGAVQRDAPIIAPR